MRTPATVIFDMMLSLPEIPWMDLWCGFARTDVRRSTAESGKTHIAFGVSRISEPRYLLMSSKPPDPSPDSLIAGIKHVDKDTAHANSSLLENEDNAVYDRFDIFNLLSGIYKGSSSGTLLRTSMINTAFSDLAPFSIGLGVNSSVPTTENPPFSYTLLAGRLSSST